MEPENLSNALVVGQGSIGQRHARLLRKRGCAVSIVSAHADGAFRSIEEAFSRREFDHVIVSSVTSRHRRDILDLKSVGFARSLLIEKPLCARLDECSDIAGVVVGFDYVAVGYNLRFNPVAKALKQAVEGQRLYEARLSVGQFLPDWRPETAFRDGSSASVAAGGGVLRDLSHEIDLALYLFGRCRRLVAHGGNLGRLDIETDEAWAIIMEMESGALLQVSLNYYDRPGQRSIALTTRDGSIFCDLVAGSISCDGQTEIFATERDDSYKALHEAMFHRSGEACSLPEAIEAMRVIDAVETSRRELRWVDL